VALSHPRSRGQSDDAAIRLEEVKLSRSSRWIVAWRLALLVFAAGIASLAVVLARHRDPRAPAGDGAFVCPMHLDVTSAAAGTCPICGMALVQARSLPRDRGRDDGASSEDSVAVARILAQAASGVADNLVGYYPAALREHFFRYETYAPAWFESDLDVAVLLYRDELPALDPAEAVTFSPTKLPGTTVELRLDSRPPEEWDHSLSLVRFRLGTGAPQPETPRGTVGWVKFPARPRHMQVIPAGAVLQSPEGPYALVIGGDRRTASKRPIAVGRSVIGLAAIVGGLALHEQVVSANAFFWDAERRLQPERLAAREGTGR
jgi:heavy metal-binding protein